MSESKQHLILLTSGQEVKHQQDSTILESLESCDIEVHYHCREGYCGACRTKLKKGTVHYTVDPLAFIDDDEILPCCCIPTTDVELELE